MVKTNKRMRVELKGGPFDGLVLIAPSGVDELPEELRIEGDLEGGFGLCMELYLLGWRIEGQE